MAVIKVAVGSTNPCKIDAVRDAFTDVFQTQYKKDCEIVVVPFSAESGVSDQPFGDEETKIGAYNRAHAAYIATNNSSTDPIDFAVGLEGGLEKCIHPQSKESQLYCMAWMAIVARKQLKDSSGNERDGTSDSNDLYCSYAKTASFLLPPKICELVLEEGMELGYADDQVFDRTNSKHGSGTVGVLTDGNIDRKDYYVHALQLCLIPWLKHELYIKS